MDSSTPRLPRRHAQRQKLSERWARRTSVSPRPESPRPESPSDHSACPPEPPGQYNNSLLALPDACVSMPFRDDSCAASLA